MAFSDEPRPYATDTARTEPAHEQAKLLEARLTEAQENVDQGRLLIREWEPVVASCRSGLEALKIAQSEHAMAGPLPEPSARY